MQGVKLEENDYVVKLAPGDADVLLVNEAIDQSNYYNTTLVGEDTYFLILLLYHAKKTNFRLI